MSGQDHALADLPSCKYFGTHGTGDWVGSQSRSGSFMEDKNFLHLPGSFQHVAQSLYINLSVFVERKIEICVKKSLLYEPKILCD
jgi:hypothetical protein